MNTVIYLCTSNGFQIHPEIVDRFGEKSSNLSPLTMLTSMFLHANLEHLIGNMWFLYLFGFAVEGRLRSLKFSIVYLGAGICGGLLHHFLLGQYHPNLPSIGASGAIMGVMGAALYMFPHAKIQFLYTWFTFFRIGFVDFPMWGVALFYVGFDVLLAAISGRTGGGGVAHFAHIGGVIGGVAICALMLPRRDNAETSDAKAMLSETKDLGTLSRVELETLYKSNPGDTTVLLNWMTQCIRENRLTAEGTAEFVRMLPTMMREQPALSVGSCVSSLSAINDCIEPRTLVQLAGKIEREGNPTFALHLYSQALRDTRVTVADEECALYRSGLLYETRLSNKPLAATWYEELIKRHPSGSWADQAKARLSSLNRAP